MYTTLTMSRIHSQQRTNRILKLPLLFFFKTTKPCHAPTYFRHFKKIQCSSQNVCQRRLLHSRHQRVAAFSSCSRLAQTRWCEVTGGSHLRTANSCINRRSKETFLFRYDPVGLVNAILASPSITLFLLQGPPAVSNSHKKMSFYD